MENRNVQVQGGMQERPVLSARRDEMEPPPYWLDRTRVFLLPTAPPSILGLFGFGLATFVTGARMADWYGDRFTSWGSIAPFVFFMGLAQFLAAMWGFRARDTFSTAFHGIWGIVWAGVGVFFFLIGIGTIPSVGYAQPELGFLFVALAVVSFLLLLGAMPRSVMLVICVVLLAIACVLLSIGLLHDISGTVIAAGWCLVFSAFASFYVAEAILLERTFGKVVLPLTKYAPRSNIPGSVVSVPIEYAEGMPGARVNV